MPEIETKSDTTKTQFAHTAGYAKQYQNLCPVQQLFYERNRTYVSEKKIKQKKITHFVVSDFLISN